MTRSLSDLLRDAAQHVGAAGSSEAAERLQRAIADGLGAAFGTHPGSTWPMPPGDPMAVPPWLRPRQADSPEPGTVVEGRHSLGGRSLAYKLYSPPIGAAARSPLVVMLHGCTQDADDFAAGSRMNALARERGFRVLYPTQDLDQHPQRCWNWFKHNHQGRDGGEPALIASLTQSLVSERGLDARRVYVAGLSAGGAMAALVAAAFPDVFAAAGVHSGLAPGAAHNLSDALAAMRSGSHAGTPPIRMSRPVIVFHGDQDDTVHPDNAERVIDAALARVPKPSRRSHVEQGLSEGGRPFTRTVHRTAEGTMLAEQWIVQGAGHAWSGGSNAGRFTDPRGPDASAQMLRFFLDHPRDDR